MRAGYAGAPEGGEVDSPGSADTVNSTGSGSEGTAAIAPVASGSAGTRSIAGGNPGTGGIDPGCAAAFGEGGEVDAGVAVAARPAGAAGVGAGVVNTGSIVLSVSISTNVVRCPGDGRVSAVVSSGGASPSTGGGLIAIVAIRYFDVSRSRLGGRIAPAATVAAKTST